MHITRILFFIFFIAGFFLPAYGTVLSKVYHHTSLPQDQGKNIQLGGISCVFSDAPVINQMHAEDKVMKKLHLFIPDGMIQGMAKNKCDLRSAQDGAYAVRIAPTSVPKKGIQIFIEYDPQRIVFSRDILPRVTREHKLVLSFYDKKLLESIKKNIEVPTIVHANLNPSVVIDVGHGGNDAGVTGCLDVQEKHICLAVGKKVAQELKKNDISVFLTREDDRYISLENRIRMINAKHPSLCVSIHANAGGPHVAGIETYYTDMNVANKKCATSDYEHIINDLHRMQAGHNRDLAQLMQTSVCRHLADHGMLPVDRSTKAEPLELLMGATMPAALIEIGFLTHKASAQQLLQDDYQSLIAHGICDGIKKFFWKERSNYV